MSQTRRNGYNQLAVFQTQCITHLMAGFDSQRFLHKAVDPANGISISGHLRDGVDIGFQAGLMSLIE